MACTGYGSKKAHVLKVRLHYFENKSSSIIKKKIMFNGGSTLSSVKFSAHMQNPPPLTNRVVTFVAFSYVWGCIIYYIQPN